MACSIQQINTKLYPTQGFLIEGWIIFVKSARKGKNNEDQKIVIRNKDVLPLA